MEKFMIIPRKGKRSIKEIKKGYKFKGTVKTHSIGCFLNVYNKVDEELEIKPVTILQLFDSNVRTGW
jgi:hypothetical protein